MGVSGTGLVIPSGCDIIQTDIFFVCWFDWEKCVFYSSLHSCVEIRNGASVCLIPNETTRYFKKKSI